MIKNLRLAVIALFLAPGLSHAAGMSRVQAGNKTAASASHATVTGIKTAVTELGIGGGLSKLDGFWTRIVPVLETGDAQASLGLLEKHLSAKTLKTLRSGKLLDLTEDARLDLMDQLDRAAAKARKEAVELADEARPAAISSLAQAEAYAAALKPLAPYSADVAASYERAKTLAAEMKRLKLLDGTQATASALSGADAEEALRTLVSATLNDSAGAQHTLALMHEQGWKDVVPKDATKAVAWHKAAALKLPQAQLALAKIHAEGRGVDKDPVKAYAYSKLAATYESDSRGWNTPEGMASREAAQFLETLAKDKLKPEEMTAGEVEYAVLSRPTNKSVLRAVADRELKLAELRDDAGFDFLSLGETIVFGGIGALVGGVVNVWLEPSSALAGWNIIGLCAAAGALFWLGVQLSNLRYARQALRDYLRSLAA